MHKNDTVPFLSINTREGLKSSLIKKFPENLVEDIKETARIHLPHRGLEKKMRWTMMLSFYPST